MQKGSSRPVKEDCHSNNLEFHRGRCQTKHKPRKCPAFGKKCSRCGLYNHYAVGCRVRKVRELAINESSSESSNCDSLKLHSVTPNKYGKNRFHPNEWRENIYVEDKRVSFFKNTLKKTLVILKESLCFLMIFCAQEIHLKNMIMW